MTCPACLTQAEATAFENLTEELGRHPEADELAAATLSNMSMAADLWHDAHVA